jgi:hypothetical protein
VLHALALPNVKDEPRRELAQSMRSMICDRSRRWLWRLVRPFVLNLREPTHANRLAAKHHSSRRRS